MPVLRLTMTIKLLAKLRIIKLKIRNQRKRREDKKGKGPTRRVIKQEVLSKAKYGPSVGHRFPRSVKGRRRQASPIPTAAFALGIANFDIIKVT